MGETADDTDSRINFQLEESPKWRKNDQKLPSVEDMVKEIVVMQKKWASCKETVTAELAEKVKSEFVTLFINSVNCRDRHDPPKTGQPLLESVNARKAFDYLSKVIKEEDHLEGSAREVQGIPNTEQKSTTEDLESSKKDQENVTEEHESPKAEQRNVTEEHESPKAEQRNVTEEHESPKAEQKTVTEDHESPKAEQKNVTEEHESPIRYLLVDIVKKMNKIILQGQHSEQVEPGVFSSNPRKTSWKSPKTGIKYEHSYKETSSKEDMEEEVRKLLDQYNSFVKFLTDKEKDDEKKAHKLFKISGWLIFKFLDLHPFGDGNGRLCMILCSYVLSIMTPFPTPIYNMCSNTDKDDYMQALVDTWNVYDYQPRSLTTLIIECNWFGWKDFLARLGLAVDSP